MVDLNSLSDEKLAALEEDLAQQRTAIREQQNAVAAEIAIRRALESMPEAARNIVKLRLEGGISSAGEASGAKK